jgi:hypothetical protein
MMKIRKYSLLLAAMVLVLAVQACGSAASSTQQVDAGQIPITSGGQSTNTPITHVMMPNQAQGLLSEITDTNSKDFASQKRTNGGDSFSKNLYERPFNANTMDAYFPQLDIIDARLTSDANWFYVTIKVVGKDANNSLSGDYGIELDLNRDGRGDFLIMASAPKPTWSTDGVRVWQDTNGDVGGKNPIKSDNPVTTLNGYDIMVFNQGVGTDPDAAWAQISPLDSNSVQIAFKRTLINNASVFLWGAWAMSDSSLNPAAFDNNDAFTMDQAGSPLTEQGSYYPVKSLAEMDNTCRWTVGYTPAGTEPGLCPLPAPTPTPKPILPGHISGIVFYDVNWNGKFDGTDTGYSFVTVRVRVGSCGAPGGTVGTTITDDSGKYSISVSAGNYCVDVPTPPGGNTGGAPVNVTVSEGGSAEADFGYYYYLT